MLSCISRWLYEPSSPDDERQGSHLKTITFAIPCYNSAEYMETCIKSILSCDDGTGDIEIIIVNDGSTKDNTAEIADKWQDMHPGIIRAIHQENGGHGSAVNAGLAAAQGIYYKVVDSDDWLDADAMAPIMKYLREQCSKEDQTDLVIANYVYEKVFEGTRTVIDYKNIFPQDKEFGWEDTGRFKRSQYLLMHSAIYRTELLREIGLKLPEHCFYVDNIFVYVPLPAVKTMRYFDTDMYRYFIGREGQSVNEDIMMARIDQQIRITRIMIDAVDPATEVPQPKLARYMENYLSMMMCICSVFLRMSGTEENDRKRKDLWAYLKSTRPKLYPKIRRDILNAGTNIPTPVGKAIGIGGYHLCQKIFKFN